MSSKDVEEMLDRLRSEIARAGFQSLAEASRAAGDETPQGLRDVVSGRKRCSVEYLMRLGEIGVDVTYVMTGQPTSSERGGAPAAYRVSDGAPVAAASGPGEGLAEVPLYDVEGAAGSGRDLECERVEGVVHFPETELSALGISPARVAGVRVRGDSMEPTLADGDWVLINRGDRPERPEGVFLLLVEGERRIKRVQRVAGGAWMLISDNTHYRPEMIPPENLSAVEILGRCAVRIGRIS